MEHTVQHTKPVTANNKRPSFFSPLFVQPKLVVGPVDDEYEREADSMADQVMRMPANTSESSFFKASSLAFSSVQPKCAACEEELQRQEEEPGAITFDKISEPGIQRKCSECEDEEQLQMKPAFHNLLQRQCSQCEEEEQLQMKGDAGAVSGMSAPTSVNSVISQGGQSIDASTRGFMESRFGYDFSNVRIHNDVQAHRSSSDIHALAYTHRNHIVFSSGQYQPYTASGKRLLAHELSHVVQQTQPTSFGATGQAGGFAKDTTAPLIQREVNPGRVEDAETVLKKIKTLGENYKELGKYMGPAVANMARIAAFGMGFNPGADTSEKNNSFVYTCRCGWIDLGHFFITAATSYMAAFVRQFESLKPGNIPFFNVPITDIPRAVLVGGQKHLRPLLDLLLSTVTTGDQAKPILQKVDKLLASGDPNDVALAYGYWMEYFQQAVKLYADTKANPSETLKGSQRSAFTMEDLPSDAYGAYFGERLWKMVSMDAKDSSPYYDIMKQFFADCGAVYSEPESVTRCEMMAETTPGSCSIVNGKPKWTLPGEPARYTSTTPYLLKSAKTLCKGHSDAPLPYRPAEQKVEGADEKDKADDTVGRSLLFRGFRLRLGGGLQIDNFLMDPMEEIPTTVIGFRRRRMSITVLDDLEIGGGFRTVSPLIGGIGLDGRFWGTTTVNVPKVGAVGTTVSGDFNLESLKQVKLPLKTEFDFGSGFSIGALITVQYDHIKDLQKGPLAPEAEKIKTILKSKEFQTLVAEVVFGDLKAGDFKKQVINMIKEQFPGTLAGNLETIMYKVLEDILYHATAEVAGTGKLGPVPIFGVRAGKAEPVTIAGNKAPVFYYLQYGLLFPQLIGGDVVNQFPFAAGVTADWIAGDPRAGGPGLKLGGTIGMGIPQGELFLEGHAILADDKGLQIKAGFYYGKHRFGPREDKISDPPDLRLPADLYQFTKERHMGPIDLYLQVQKNDLKFGLRHERDAQGTDTTLLTVGKSFE